MADDRESIVQMADRVAKARAKGTPVRQIILDDPPRSGHDRWPRLEPDDKPPHLATDQYNGYLLALHHGKNLLYVVRIGWHSWMGTHWHWGEEFAYRKAQQLSRLVLADAATASTQAAVQEDSERRKAFTAAAETLVRWARKSEGRDKVYAAMAMAKPMLALEHHDLDRDNWLLNCPNGTLDLRTGQLRPHRRDDFITRCLPVAYDSKAACPTWLTFLDRIFASTAQVIHFVQKALGYALTGDTSEQCVFFLWGEGQNGKSTFLNTIQSLMGRYAQQAAPDLLVVSKQDRHSTEIAELRGARLVASIETGEGRRLNEVLIKQMSGGDKMRGHFMRQDNIEFDPTHKVFLATNHKPVIRGTDHAIWRRIRLIPFTVTIPPEERDQKLPGKLKTELPGILAWAVQGCLDWQKEGLDPPREVAHATVQYRADMDVIKGFLDECCVMDKNARVPKSELYETYKGWCDRSGEYAETQRKFSDRLQERGFFEERRKYSRLWRGLGLLAASPHVPDDSDTGDAGDKGDAVSDISASNNISRIGDVENNVTYVTSVTHQDCYHCRHFVPHSYTCPSVLTGIADPHTPPCGWQHFESKDK